MLGPADIWARLGGAEGQSPRRLGSRHGPLLIMGGGRSLWADVAMVDRPGSPWPGERMMVNDVGQHYQRVAAHWVTLHPEYFPGWRFYRERHCYGEGRMPTCHSNRSVAGVDMTWPLTNVGGTSGLFGCYIGLMLGYERIVLAGVPMDNSGHYFDAPDVGTDFDVDRATGICWQSARDTIFEGRVRSVSGRTREWLGAP